MQKTGLRGQLCLHSWTFLVLKAVYFSHVLGNQIYWTDLCDQCSSPQIIQCAVVFITLNSWCLVLGLLKAWWLVLGRELTENPGTWKLWIPGDWFWVGSIPPRFAVLLATPPQKDPPPCQYTHQRGHTCLHPATHTLISTLPRNMYVYPVGKPGRHAAA